MSIVQVLKPRLTELTAGLTVRRLLPSARQRSVGPFVFFDHFGPVELPAHANADVGPHPHIGLATVTYLFEGEFIHRDSLGTVQSISPGAVNWMSAGRGIVHSERTPHQQLAMSKRLHGLQLWTALPEALESSDPTFQHVDASAIPEVAVATARVRVLAGSAFGAESPARTTSPTLYLDVWLGGGQELLLPPLAEEMALYCPQEEMQVDGQALPSQQLAVLDTATDVVIGAERDTRFVVIGGQRLTQQRHMWWNFVATQPARIEEAARLWETDAFPRIPGETKRVQMPRFVSSRT